MKLLVAACLFSIACLTSCCFTSQKCDAVLYMPPALRILDANDKNLLFGPDKVYDINDVQLYTLTGGDTLFYNFTAGIAAYNTQDSVLYTTFGNNQQQPATVYLVLNSTDADTLMMTYQTHKVKCCGSTTSVSSYKYNNTTVKADNSGVITVRK